MEPSIQILVLEDHEIITWALKRVIEKGIKSTVLNSAISFKDGLHLLEKKSVDLIILDIDLEGGNSTRMISGLRRVQPNVPILVYSGLDEAEYSLKYLEAGANGFLSKSAPVTAVLEAIMIILDGKKYISMLTHETITDMFLRDKAMSHRRGKDLHLTERERDIVILLLKGKWTKEIAEELGLKMSMVSTQKGKIFEKFGVDNPVELFIVVKEDMPELLE